MMETRGMSEQEFLAAYDASEFPHPSVAVDVAVLTVRDDRLWALMVRRLEHPFKGAWALPGGFVGMDESLGDATDRVLEAKCGLTDVFSEQLYTFGDVDRDPRTRVISVAYYALVDHQHLTRTLHGDNDAAGRLLPLRVDWPGETGGDVHPVDPDGDGRALGVAFDHARILGTAVLRIRGKLNYAPIGFQLLPDRFTLRELQHVHETILDDDLNKDSFRRRMLDSGQLEATGERETDVGHRPAELYRFDPAARKTAI